MVRLPDRLEFHASPLPTANESETSDAPEFSVMPEPSIAAFREASDRVVQSEEQIHRVGVGGKLICPGKNHRDGYTLLQKRLSNVTLNPDNSDFTYKINIARERDFGGKVAKINRLCTWKCVRIDLVKVDGTLWQLFGAEMEPDINTAPNVDFSSFDESARREILSTLFDYHLEFAINGESP